MEVHYINIPHVYKTIFCIFSKYVSKVFSDNLGLILPNYSYAIVQFLLANPVDVLPGAAGVGDAVVQHRQFHLRLQVDIA